MSIEEILDYKLKKALTTEKYNLVVKADKDFILAQAKTKIQSYCHRLDIPEAAFYVWSDMAIEILKGLDSSLFTNELEQEQDLMSRVTSVKSGDAQLSFAQSTEQIKDESNSVGDALLDSFSKQLQSFRKFPNMNGCGLNGI